MSGIEIYVRHRSDGAMHNFHLSSRDRQALNRPRHSRLVNASVGLGKSKGTVGTVFSGGLR